MTELLKKLAEPNKKAPGVDQAHMLRVSDLLGGRVHRSPSYNELRDLLDGKTEQLPAPRLLVRQRGR